MSWELPPLHRHLSTIGIGPVFVSPPPPPLPPHPVEEDPKKEGNGASSGTPCCPSNQNQNQTVTWEIVGDIKSTPEDFIVREIGWAPPPPPVEHGDAKSGSKNDESGEHYTTNDIKHNTSKYRRRPGWSRRIAGLECEKQTAKNVCDEMNEGRSDHIKNDDIQLSSKEINDSVEDHESAPATKKTRTEDVETAETETLTSDKTLDSTAQLPAKPQSSPKTLTHEPAFAASPSKVRDDEDLEKSIDPNPMEGLRRILIQCHWRSNHKAADDTRENHTSQKERETAADNILEQLTDLQKMGLEEIGHKQSATSDVSSDKSDGKKMWIPTAQLFQNSPAPHMTGKEDWTLLHR